MKLKTFFSLALLLSLPLFVASQTKPEINFHIINLGGVPQITTPFGNVPKEDLSMARYDLDTSANAVVLLDNGFLTIELSGMGWRCYLTCFHRVKILKKSAFDDYGKHTITLKGSEKLLALRAQTVNPDSSIIPVKEFFDEKANQYVNLKKFAFSNLQEGSIVEYEYTVEGKDVFSLYPWYFQAAVPVRHSELVVDIPNLLEYIYFFRGRAPKQDNYETKRRSELGSELLARPASYLRYSLDSLEAMKPEGYVSAMDNYVSNMKFQLRQVNSIGTEKPRKILQDWKALAKELIETKDLGQQLNNKRNYNDIWKTVKPLLINAQKDEEKIQVIYEFISRNVDWIDDYFSIYAQEGSLDDAFKKKKANSAELNMMLIACLNEAGIKALPLLVSTIENGLPCKEYPIGRQFNHLLCYIENGEKPMFLDAGNIYRPMNIPRIVSLNQAGWVLDKDNPRWVDIPAPLSSETMLANFDLTNDGTLKGVISGNYLGYAAVNERTNLKDDEKNEKLKKAWAKAFPDIQLDSISVTNKDNLNQPFKRTMVCTIPNAAIVADDLIYLKPTLKTDFDENPFKQEKRNYPIDFPYPIRDYFVMNMTIPDGYSVEEVPKDVSLALPNLGGKFIYSCTKTENKVQLMVRIELKQLHFEVEEYETVKKFFNQIVNKKNEQIVLKKIVKEVSAKKQP